MEWTQDRIAKAKGVTQAMISMRLQLHDEFSDEVVTRVTTNKISECRCRHICKHM